MHGEPSSARAWLPILDRYRTPSIARSVFELIVTIVPFMALWVVCWLCLQWSYLLTLAVAVPAAGFLVRIFVIQHDCGHGSFFRRRLANEWVGRVLGVLTFTPFELWRRSHAIHHASTGNLDQRGIGDITTLTVGEYLGRSARRRLAYRLYRHPLVMFGIGPAYIFLVQHRLPAAGQFSEWRGWHSPLGTNIAIAAVAAMIIPLVGLKSFLLVQLPIVALASSIGVWLFYVQHQFEETDWKCGGDWSVHEAALHGSSFYALPRPLHWLTGNIGIHHVHHLCSRIPFYRLPQVLRDHPSLATVGRITVAQSLACVRLALWDEARHRLVSFRDLENMPRDDTERRDDPCSLAA